MPAIQSLKKQLRGIASTQKLTKAMRTVATVKFSKLNGLHSRYAAYGHQCAQVLEQYGNELLEALGPANESAPAAVVVMASNKGLCGNFNSEVLNFAREKLEPMPSFRLITCGKKATAYFKGRQILPAEEWVPNDVPTYQESNDLLDRLLEWRRSGQISRVYVAYPHYESMVSQTPAWHELMNTAAGTSNQPMCTVPDRKTLLEKTALPVFRAAFYQLLLETAIGAQAATLMTMRSAYDTATEYRARLEGQINRMRQSAVTADVLETAAEWE